MTIIVDCIVLSTSTYSSVFDDHHHSTLNTLYTPIFVRIESQMRKKYNSSIISCIVRFNFSHFYPFVCLLFNQYQIRKCYAALFNHSLKFGDHFTFFNYTIQFNSKHTASNRCIESSLCIRVWYMAVCNELI